MAKKSLELVVERNSFYRDNYQKLSLVLVVMLLSVVFLSWLNFHLLSNRSRPPEYFAMTCDGNFATITPLSNLMFPMLNCLHGQTLWFQLPILSIMYTIVSN